MSSLFFSPCGSTAQFLALAASMKLSVLFRLLDLGQSAGFLGRVISSSQGLCVSAPGDYEEGEVGRIVLAGEIVVLGENLPRLYFVHHKSNLPDPRANPGPRRGKPATNCLSYGAASCQVYYSVKLYLHSPIRQWGLIKQRDTFVSYFSRFRRPPRCVVSLCATLH
jgi:hypothetical protein